MSVCINIIQAEKKDVKSGSQGQGQESDRSHSQSRSSSSDKVKCRSIGASGASGGHYRRLGVVSLPPEADQDQEPGASGARVRAEVARRISLDDLSAAFQGEGQLRNCRV